MVKKRILYIISGAWELFRFGGMLLFLLQIVQSESLHLISIISAFLGANLFIVFMIALCLLLPEKETVLLQFIKSAKLFLTSAIGISIVITFVTQLFNEVIENPSLLFIQLIIPLIIFLVDLIFLVVLLSLKKEAILKV
jgi:hypothetical protein